MQILDTYWVQILHLSALSSNSVQFFTCEHLDISSSSWSLFCIANINYDYWWSHEVLGDVLCYELILTEIRYICQKYFVMSPMYGLWQLILYEWARLWCCCCGVGNIWWSTGHPVYIMAELRVTKYTQSSRKWSQWTNWSFDCRECRPTAGPFMPRSLVELQTKVREDIIITEVRAFSWLTAHTSTSTFKTVLRLQTLSLMDINTR